MCVCMRLGSFSLCHIHPASGPASSPPTSQTLTVERVKVLSLSKPSLPVKVQLQLAGFIHCTTPQMGTPGPVWDDQFVFPVEDATLQTLDVTMLDSADQVLGMYRPGGPGAPVEPGFARSMGWPVSHPTKPLLGRSSPPPRVPRRCLKVDSLARNARQDVVVCLLMKDDATGRWVAGEPPNRLTLALTARGFGRPSGPASDVTGSSSGRNYGPTQGQYLLLFQLLQHNFPHL